jgi:hypothetical protein
MGGVVEKEGTKVEADFDVRGTWCGGVCGTKGHLILQSSL